MFKKILKLSFITILLLSAVGCSQEEKQVTSPITENQTSQNHTNTFGEDFTESHIPDITIQFGNAGQPFTMHFENNQTALTIARNIGEEGKNLPIYNYDNFENYEVMQYYDIPSSYSIPSTPQTISHQKAGEVYYVAPNRIVMFYQDADLSGEYTKIGTIENVSELQSAVENNPVQEGWGNKLVLIRFVNA